MCAIVSAARPTVEPVQRNGRRDALSCRCAWDGIVQRRDVAG
jgi:hypothetical protein